MWIGASAEMRYTVIVMKKLIDYIRAAEKDGRAIGHFNISNTEQLWAIFRAARSLNLPILIGTSEGERDFIGPRQAVALIESLREQYDYPIFLNADHSYSFERVKEAVDAGYDAVIFDGTKLPLDENIETTKRCVEYAKSVNEDILVEGELGYIGSSSKLLDELPEGAEVDQSELVTPEEAKDFVEETGVDLLAPAVGNLHGMFKGYDNPALDVELIAKIRESAGVPLVLHGGSGVTNDDFRAAIDAGMSIVHINTQIRVAFKQALKEALVSNSDDIAPYRYMQPAVDAVRRVVTERLKLFNDM